MPAIAPYEFGKFLDRIDRAVPEGLEVHLILDNYGTHKTPRIHRCWPGIPVSICTSRPRDSGPKLRWYKRGSTAVTALAWRGALFRIRRLLGRRSSPALLFSRDRGISFWSFNQGGESRDVVFGEE